MRQQRKLFFVIIEIEAPNAERAVRNWKNGNIVGLLHRTQEVRELTQAIGFEATQKEWSDYENIPPETRLGFHTPQIQSKRGLKRK